MLLVGGLLVRREVAVRHVARRAVDLRQHVRLADVTIGERDRTVHVQRVAHPQVAHVLGDEAAPFDTTARCLAAVVLGSRGAPGDPFAQQQPMHARSRQLARRYPLGPLQHPDDPADGPTRLLALGPQHQVRHLGAHRATRAAVGPRVRRQTRQPLGPVRVVPGLDRARRDAHHPPVRRHVVVPRRRLEVLSPVAVLQPCADQRPEHTEAKEPDGPLRLLVHAATLLAARHHKGWDRVPPPRRPTATRRLPSLT